MYYTRQDLCALLGISTQYLYQMWEKDIGPPREKQRTVRIPIAGAIEWAEWRAWTVRDHSKIDYKKAAQMMKVDLAMLKAQAQRA